MSLLDRVTVVRVDDEAARREALQVLRVVYRDEKRWLPEEDRMLPASDLAIDGVCWFLTRVDGEPVGVVRVLFDLPVNLYREYGFAALSEAFDAEAFIAANRIAEVGRFAVVPAWRGTMVVAAALMRAATTETVGRGFTHFITDVFENEPHSPYLFHTRVLGFVPVATHDHGELAFKGRRITMLLDIKQAYQRLRRRRNWVFRFITEGWDEQLHLRVSDAV
jgi:hypothetical protein